MQSADATGKRLRSSETVLRAQRGQTGLDRLWAELAMRSLGLHGDKQLPQQPSWVRIATLLLESSNAY